VIALLVVVVVIGHQLWWSKPAAFGGRDSTGELTSQVGKPVYVNVLLSPPDGTVSVHDVEPVVVTNSAGADIDLVACRQARPTSLGAGDSLCGWCADTGPVDRADLNDVDWQVYARITAHRAGQVRIDGVDIRYSRDRAHLWQTGTEQAGVGIVVTAE
jgi:hypothetical protein